MSLSHTVSEILSLISHNLKSHVTLNMSIVYALILVTVNLHTKF